MTSDALDILAADCESVNPNLEQPASSTDLVPDNGDPDAEVPPPDAVYSAASNDNYDIHSMWKFRFLNGDLGWIPLRYGYHTGAGKGFGYRHIKAQRGWAWGIRWNMNRTLMYGRLVEQGDTEERGGGQGSSGATGWSSTTCV